MRNGSTFGQDMLSIKYKNLSKKKNFFYVILTSLDYVKSCIEKYSLDGNLNNHIFRVEVFCRICSLLNIMSFLRNGTKPRLVERFLALEQVYAHENSQRRFETKYQTRELLWNGFIVSRRHFKCLCKTDLLIQEILVYILPIINYHKIKRIVNKVNPFASVSSFARLQNTASMSVDTKCVYCAETPILPHHMGCKHIFCYICLKVSFTMPGLAGKVLINLLLQGNQIADSQFECPVCGYSSHNVTCDKFIP